MAKLSRWSVGYYNDTARAAGQAATNARTANGGLGEYYSEADTRVPVWLLAGDTTMVADLVGLSDGARVGGAADPEVVARWLDDGVAPSGECGRALGERGVHGFDLTFCAPKSVSLLRAVRADDVTQKAVANAHTAALSEAMEYLAAHAGYTRVHNPISGEKDLVKLPGIVAAAYQHETSRAGDPHLHTHVLVPNRQARSDGRLVSLDGTSLYHEARAAGIIYQATLRRELHQSLGVEWAPVDARTGMADLAGIDPKNLAAWSKRSTQLREWAANNLVVTDAVAGPTQGQLAAAQKATRPRKPEGMAWAELQRMWAADGRGFVVDEAAQVAARVARVAAARGVNPLGLARAAAARIDKPAFTRADLVEAIGAVLPVQIERAPGTARTQIETLVGMVGTRITAARMAHQREGFERFTTPEIIAEEAAVLGLMGARDERSVLPNAVVDDVVDDAGLSADQARAIRNVAGSPWLIAPLSAPAGAGKTTSLKALRAAAHRAGGQRRVVVVAPTGAAVDVAVREGAGDTGMTVAKALRSLRDETWTVDSSTLVVVDEAGMVGTGNLRELLTATTAAGAKTVLVGDAHQLAPVKARGGMFAQLCADLPWTQRLSEVWRMTDPAERSASLAIRDGGPAPLRRAVGWCRRQGRLHAGDPVAMAADALTGWQADTAAGRDSLLIADTWEMADALNLRIHGDTVAPDAPTVTGARGHQIGVGDVIISRRNDPTVAVYDATEAMTVLDAPVRNGNRWQVYKIDAKNQRIAARRLGDGARAVFTGDYLAEHVHHGFAVTVHAAQGATADTTHAVLGEGANRAAAYVAMTRGRTANAVYLYEKVAGEGDHEHADPEVGVHLARRGTSHDAAALLRTVIGRDDRAQTVMEAAADVERDQLPDPVRELLDAHDRTRAACRTAYRTHVAARAAERDLAAMLPGLRAEVALLEVAGERSGAGMFGTSEEILAGVDESSRAAVAAVGADVHSVQVLAVHPGGGKAAVLAAISAAAREHQGRWFPARGTQPGAGVLALPATAEGAEYAAAQGYADRIRHPVAAVRNFESGKWTLPIGSLVIVDDADQLPPTQLQSLIEHAATRTNTKLLLITNHHGVDDATERTAPEGADAVTALHDRLPWAQTIGTPRPSSIQRDNVIDGDGQRRAATGIDTLAQVEVTELLARREHLAGQYRNEVTARDRFHTDMIERSRSRDLGLSRDDGLEL